MDTPVAFIIFNRPETTERVFAEIAKARPRKLFVIADGPRSDRPGDAEKCAQARAVVARVDWDCEVFQNYSDINLGCGRRPATGITWVFEQVEEAIILEDDCVPHPTFFPYCEELLEKYRDDERIMHIGGTHMHLYGRQETHHSYYFSCLPAVWGWATWRRAWKHHEIAITLWPELRGTSWLLDILGDPRAAEYWGNIFDRAYAARGGVDYWDYQWTFACWAQSGLAILPNTNLISNIGFGQNATHTMSENDKLAHLAVQEMLFPLAHPPCVAVNGGADRLFFKQCLPAKSKHVRLYQRVLSAIPFTIPTSLEEFISLFQG